MRCVFPNCERESNETFQGVTYHKFPAEPTRLAAWVVALCQAGWQVADLSPHDAVCSLHFPAAVWVENAGDRRELCADAVPGAITKNEPQWKDSTEEAQCDVKVCRVCLNSHCKLYPLTEYKILYKAYEALTGLLLEHEEHLPRYLCAECAGRLLSCDRFRTRSLRAHLMLLDVARNHDRITLELIQSVDDHRNWSDENECLARTDRDLDIELSRGVNISTTETDKENINDLSGHVKDIKQGNDDLNNGKSLIDESHTNDVRNIYTNDIKIENDDVHGQIVLNAAEKIDTDMISIRNLPKDIFLVDIKVEREDIDDINLPSAEDTTNAMVFMSSLPEDILDSIKAGNDDMINQKSFNFEYSTTPIEETEEYSNITQDTVRNDARTAKVQRGDADVGADNSVHILPLVKSECTEEPVDENEGETNAADEEKVVNNNRLSCDLCLYRANSESTLLTHRKTHTTPATYNCHVCDFKAVTKQTLTGHLKTHNPRKIYSCDDCSRTFSSNAAFEGHVQTHQQKSYSCGICKKRFKTEPCLKRHLSTHPGQKPFTCDMCFKTYMTKASLNTHTRTVHSGKTYRCHVCNKEIKRIDNFKSHLMTHTGEKPFTCNICDKSFTTRSTLKIHQRKHSGHKPYSCEICNNSFYRSDDLKQHLLVHSGKKPFACQLCGTAFSKSNNLKKHMRIHSGERPYSCDACAKTFNRKDDLKKHLGTHFALEQYECDMCQKAFSRKDCLILHLRVHAGQSLYACQVCDKPFYQKSNLKTHMRAHARGKLNG